MHLPSQFLVLSTSSVELIHLDNNPLVEPQNSCNIREDGYTELDLDGLSDGQLDQIQADLQLQISVLATSLEISSEENVENTNMVNDGPNNSGDLAATAHQNEQTELNTNDNCRNVIPKQDAVSAGTGNQTIPNLLQRIIIIRYYTLSQTWLPLYRTQDLINGTRSLSISQDRLPLIKARITTTCKLYLLLRSMKELE